MPNTPDDWKTTARCVNPGRAEIWRRIYGTDVIPLKSFVPQRGSLPGKPDALFYEVDTRVITPEQRARLVDYLSEAFNQERSFVENNLDLIGVPVLADDVMVSSTDSGLFYSLVLDDFAPELEDVEELNWRDIWWDDDDADG